MTSDEIMQVLRLTAMSRVNHPDQQRFCDKLAEVFAGWVAPVSAEKLVAQITPENVHAEVDAPKRTKKAKAD